MRNIYRKYCQPMLSFLAGKLFLKIMSGILVTFILYALVMMMISAGKAELNIIGMDGKDALTAEELSILSDDEAFDLLQQKAFYSSAMTRAKDDSIGLSIDLHTRSVALEIKGVPIFSRPIEDADISPYIKTLSDPLLINLASAPSTVVSSRSTIIKEPIIVKKAPKDTSEVQLNPYQIDTSYREPAILIMELDNGIELILKQHGGVSFKDYFKYNSFIFRERMNRTGKLLKAIFSGRVPEYIPSVTIEMTAKDIRVIYRALPQHPRVSLRVK